MTMHRKLASLVVPNVEFRATTLPEAVDFLAQEAARVDPHPEDGPTGRGANLVIVQARKAVLPAGKNGRISLEGHDVPLLDALRQSAAQAGMTVTVYPYDVLLVPAQAGVLADPFTLVQVPPNDPAAEAMAVELEKTALPNVEFRGASLRDALGYLNQQGAALVKGGIKFTLSQTNPPDAEARSLTLTVQRIPLMEMVRLLCLQGDLKAQITAQGVVFEAAKTK